MTTSASEVSVCSHLFTVKGYTHTRGIGVDRAIESPAFDAAGHRRSVAFYPDGVEEDSRGYISIYIKLVDGTGDATVLYGVSLVDPTGAAPALEASKAPKVETFRSGWSWGFGSFIEHQTFEASPYLRNDCVTIKCVIGAVRGPDPPPLPAAASELLHNFDRLVVDGGSSEDTKSDGGSSENTMSNVD